MSRSILVLSLLLTLLVASPARATSVLELSVQVHVADSSAVVEATVGAARQTLDEASGRPLTHTRLTVTSVLAGAAPVTLELSQWKGTVGDRSYGFAGDGELTEGTSVLLFLMQAEGRWWLTALAQSVWELDGRGDDANAVRHLDGLAFFRRDPATGALVPARKGADAAVSTLGALRSAVRAAGGGR